MTTPFLRLYKHTVRHSWHDICVNAYLEEGEEMQPEYGDDVYTSYGYAFSPSVFYQEDGGYSSRKDSSFTETLEVTPVDSLPPGEELHYGMDDTWKTLHTQLGRSNYFLFLLLNPITYFRYRFLRDVRYYSKELWRHQVMYRWYSIQRHFGWGWYADS